MRGRSLGQLAAAPDLMPAVAGVAGALMIAMSAPLVRLSAVAPSTSAAFRCLYALPVLGILALRERRRYGPRPRADRMAAMTAGLFFVGDLTLWHHAIDLVGAGLATVLANVQVVVVGLVAWLLLGERPSSRAVAAVPLVLVGVVFIAGLSGGGYGASPVTGTVLGVLTAFAYSGFILCLRRGNADRRRPAGPLFEATAVGAVGTVLVGALLGGIDLVPAWPAHGWLLLLALNSQVLAWLLISVSLPRLPALATSILLLIQPVGSVVVGMTLLDEQPSALQLAGVSLVLAGVALASYPRRRTARTQARTLTPSRGG
jgi:drug/metabolite transporter (DMT)-like permease